MFSPRQAMLVAVAFVAISFSTATVVRADPIITPVGTANDISSVFSGQFSLVRFTLGNFYSNVSIAASLTSTAAGRTGTAFLTNQVGPGTTPANQLASTGFTFAQVPNAATVSYVNLFSGLSLAPGEYFVVFSSTNIAANQGITLGSGVTYATAPGVSVGVPQISFGANVNFAYPPASTFGNSGAGNRFFTVDGTLAPTTIPEPATMLLLGTGLAGVAAKVQRRRRDCRSDAA